MRSGILLLALAVCVLAADYRAMFEQFKIDYHRKYQTQAEEEMRYEVFVQNMLVAQGLAAENPLATFGVNNFADMTAQEFASRYRNAKKYFASYNVTNYASPDATATCNAAQVDWRSKGKVTPVKNQGSCGSCWSFSAAGNIESQCAISTGKLVSLSEQELVSCDTSDYACDGGLMDNAFKWLLNKRAGQIVTAASYPYTSGNGAVASCSLTGKTVGATITGQYNVPRDETTIATYVCEKGPLSIGIDATSWQTYKSGVLTSCVSSQMNHGVLLVGYDNSASTPYWIIKNSWGTTWGESGYIRIRKGVNACLIRDAVSSSVC